MSLIRGLVAQTPVSPNIAYSDPTDMIDVILGANGHWLEILMVAGNSVELASLH